MSMEDKYQISSIEIPDNLDENQIESEVLANE